MGMKEQPADGVSVHTGFPNAATDQSLQTLDLNGLLIRHSASTYFFRIEGNDWATSGVFDGDIAIIDRALDPRKNDVVLWWDDPRGEFAVGIYAHMPQEASVWGVVTSTIHELRSTARE